MQSNKPITMENNQKENDCISKKEVEHLIAAGKKILILDVRSSKEYKEQHIEGALNISVDKLQGKLEELKKTELIITACGNGGGRSTKAAQLLTERGFSSKWLCGGTFGWN